MKTCCACGADKPLSSFSRKSSARDGLQSRCRDCQSAYIARYKRKTPKEQVLAASKRYYQRNKEKVLPANSRRAKAWAEMNPERRRENRRRSDRKRRTAPESVLRYRMSSRIRRALAGKPGRTFDILDYTLDELRSHIERQFTKGMGWHNADEWHIDHIVPISALPCESVSDPNFKRVWALANLRPIWAAENLRKGARRLSLL